MKEDIRGLASKADLAAGLEGVRKEIAEAKYAMVRWMFVFWVGQIAVGLALEKAWR